MTDEELRHLVRRVVADRLGTAAHPSGTLGHHTPVTLLDARAHTSHGTFRVPAGSETGGPCVIEPAVPCDHCGYCKSLGH
jgi:hypothetical protein